MSSGRPGSGKSTLKPVEFLFDLGPFVRIRQCEIGASDRFPLLGQFGIERREGALVLRYILVGVDRIDRAFKPRPSEPLSAYSHRRPWATRRGFDSLVQTATGFNEAEGLAAASDGHPKALPIPILDYASGFLMAFGAQVALILETAVDRFLALDTPYEL